MNRVLKSPAAVSAAILLASALLLDTTGPIAQPSVPAAEPSARSVACTLKRLDLAGRRLQGIVGVGHALRIVNLELAPGCKAAAGGRLVSLRAIRPGDIVRVHYEPRAGAAATPSRGLATRIEVLLPAPDRGRP